MEASYADQQWVGVFGTDTDLGADREMLQVALTNFPNPFNPETRIAFVLPEAADVKLTVYNIKGQQVRKLALGDFGSGYHHFAWDGKDESGGMLASGIYLARMEIVGRDAEPRQTVFTRRMLLLK